MKVVTYHNIVVALYWTIQDMKMREETFEWGMPWDKERITTTLMLLVIYMAHSSRQFEGIYQEHIYIW